MALGSLSLWRRGLPVAGWSAATLALSGGTLDVANKLATTKGLTAMGNATIAGGGTVTVASTAAGTLETGGQECAQLTISGFGTTLANDGTLSFTGFTNEGNNGGLNLAEGARLLNAGTLPPTTPRTPSASAAAGTAP